MIDVGIQASTNNQEFALTNVERWSRAYGKPLYFGKMIGNSPKTMILNFKYGDYAIYIYPNGKITVWNSDVSDFEDFRDVVMKHDAKEADNKVDDFVIH